MDHIHLRKLLDIVTEGSKPRKKKFLHGMSLQQFVDSSKGVAEGTDYNKKVQDVVGTARAAAEFRSSLDDLNQASILPVKKGSQLVGLFMWPTGFVPLKQFASEYPAAPDIQNYTRDLRIDFGSDDEDRESWNERQTSNREYRRMYADLLNNLGESKKSVAEGSSFDRWADNRAALQLHKLKHVKRDHSGNKETIPDKVQQYGDDWERRQIEKMKKYRREQDASEGLVLAEPSEDEVPYEDESDKALIKFCRELGLLKHCVIDDDGDLVNREEVIAALKAHDLGQMTEAKLGGVRSRKLEPDEFTGLLHRSKTKTRKKTDKFKYPYVHGSNIPIVDSGDGTEYDTDALRELFTERPQKILKQNEKMQHSDGTSSIYFNIGLPALKGLAVDEDTGEFVVIDTCPGAGQCQNYCYAMKGGYVQWKASSLAGTRLLNFLYNDPEGFMNQLAGEITALENKYKKKKTRLVIRWHDAGDFFSPQYLDLAYDLARRFPDVDFYAYTKLADVAAAPRPANFKINFSQGAQGREERKIDFKRIKHSRVVPRELFKDALAKGDGERWMYRSPEALNDLRERIAQHYKVPVESVITYTQLMKHPDTGEPDKPGKWNVIVKPGDGDDAANRHDVLGSYLLIH